MRRGHPLRVASSFVTMMDLVHPALVVRVAATFIGVDVAAVLVEVDLAVLLAHVDFELAGGAAALPAVVAVAYAEVALAEAEGESSAWGEPDVEIPDQSSAELRESAEAVVPFEQDGDADEDVDRDEVLRLHADDEVEADLLIAGDDSEGDQQGEDGSPCSQGDQLRPQIEDMREGDGRGQESAGGRRDEVELQQPAGAEDALQIRAGEP